MRRRTVLASIATLPAVTGCLGTDDAADGDGAGGAASDDGSADGGQSVDGAGGGGRSAALESIDGLPTLGESPADADRVIVAFEDPACPSCGQFHESDLPDVQSELIDDGYASLVWRPYRFVSQIYPWNGQAIHAVLEAEARETDAGWELLDFYYGDQDAFDTGTIAEETRTYVEESLSIDADAVVEAMENDAHQSLVAESESIGDDAGVTSTPTFLLFDGGEYVTSRHGSTSPTEFRAGFEA